MFRRSTTRRGSIPSAEAARLLVLDRLSQIEVAKRLGVSDRAIRTWLKDKVFTCYVEQLESEKRHQQAEARQIRTDEVEETLRAGRMDAVARLVELAHEGDFKAISLLAKSLL